MERITDKFNEASYKERLAFNKLRSLYNLFNEDKWSVYITPYEGSDVYDVLVQNKEYKRIIIEIKIRGERATQCGLEEGFIYESKKHKSLSMVKDLDKDNNTIMYINFTTKGTYIWNIDKMDLKPIKKEMNKATMSGKDKMNKTVYLLQAKDAKFYSYVYDDEQYWNEEKNIDKDIRLSRMIKQYSTNYKFPGEE